jgi:DUF1680 family protein
MWVNGQSVDPRLSPIQEVPATACGFDPRLDKLAVIERTWREGDRLDYGFELPIRLLRQSERIPGCGGKVAVTRGPLVYCLESTDNPGGVLGLAIRSGSLVPRFDKDLFGGIQIIEGESSEGRRLRFIPYYAWANRGQSQMTVFVSAEPLSPDK